MRKRCYNPSNKQYKDYGGRGIKVCDRWLDNKHGFENFLQDMGPRPSSKHSIERRDNNGNYCPENCYWATKKEQSRNTRRNCWLSAYGKTIILTDWAQELACHYTVIIYHLRRGKTMEWIVDHFIKKEGANNG